MRIFPTLLYRDFGLWKGRGFRDHTYLGDVLNAVRIYNLQEADELAVIDIAATSQGRAIDPAFVAHLAVECMMPLTVGGGIASVEQIERYFSSGAEKVIVNSHGFDNIALFGEAAAEFGSQSLVCCIDVVKADMGYRVATHNASRLRDMDPVEYARRAEDAGAGEILLQSVDRDGNCDGYDLELIRAVAGVTSVPVIAAGGAGCLEDFAAAASAGATAATAGALFTFYGRRRAVLINYPSRDQLERALGSTDGHW
jgi:cyclase